MRNKGHKQPDPRQQILNDLTKEIQKRRRSGDEVIVSMDANDSLDRKGNKMLPFLAQTGLLNLHGVEAIGPRTHNRGRDCIDYIFGTPNVYEAVTTKGYLPFNGGAWISDHRLSGRVPCIRRSDKRNRVTAPSAAWN